jgi:hypothetical protein
LKVLFSKNSFIDPRSRTLKTATSNAPRNLSDIFFISSCQTTSRLTSITAIIFFTDTTESVSENTDEKPLEQINSFILFHNLKGHLIVFLSQEQRNIAVKVLFNATEYNPLLYIP